MSEDNALPQKIDGTRLCISVNKEGVTAYGNRQAFESLAKYFLWLASSNPSEHYELHTILSLQDEESLFKKKLNRNVYALLADEVKLTFENKNEDSFGFELTFMMATEAELNKLGEIASQDSD